jgi:hypothetical protein
MDVFASNMVFPDLALPVLPLSAPRPFLASRGALSEGNSTGAISGGGAMVSMIDGPMSSILYITCAQMRRMGSTGGGRLMKLFLFVLLVSVLCVAHAEADTVGLKAYRLGMSLADMKKLPPPPKGDGYPGSSMELICSNDDAARKDSDLKSALWLRHDLASIGLVRCAYFLRSKDDLTGGAKYSETAMIIARGPYARVSFFFYPLKELKLFRIYVDLAHRDYVEISEALHAKYGEPKNDRGSMTWSVDQADIVLNEHASARYDDSELLYIDRVADLLVSAKLHVAAKEAADDL